MTAHDDLLALLAEIQARADAATPEPWTSDPQGVQGTTVRSSHGNKASRGALFTIWEDVGNGDDGPFLIHARTDVPRLVAALRVAVRMIPDGDPMAVCVLAALKGEKP